MTFFQDYLEVQFDPAHLLAELGFNLVFDFLVLWLIWGRIIKPYVASKLAQQHEELDVEHGVDHDEYKSVEQMYTEMIADPDAYFADVRRRYEERIAKITGRSSNG